MVHNRISLVNALVVCDKYGLFLQTDQFFVHKVKTFLGLFWFEINFFHNLILVLQSS